MHLYDKLLVCHVAGITEGWIDHIVIKQIENISEYPIKLPVNALPFIQHPTAGRQPGLREIWSGDLFAYEVPHQRKLSRDA